MSDFWKATPLSLALIMTVISSSAGARGMPSTSESIGDWQFECFEIKDQPDACQLHQRIVAENSNVVALAAALTVNASGNIETQIALPLGIALSQPPRLQLDSEVVASIPISRCTNEGCFIEGVLPTELMAQVLNSDRAEIIVFSTDGNALTLPFPIRGLADGLARLEKVKPEPPEDMGTSGDTLPDQS